MSMSVMVVCLENTLLTSNSVRFCLESFGYSVYMKYISTSDDFIEVFANKVNYDAIIIDGHGDNGSFFLPEVSPQVALRYQYYQTQISTSKINELINHITLKASNKKQVVISCACTTGTKEWSELFVSNKGSCYIGCSGYPDSQLMLLFIINFFQSLNGNSMYSSYIIAKKEMQLHKPDINKSELPQRFICN